MDPACGHTEGWMTVEALRRGRPAVLADLLDRYGRDMQAVAYLIVRDRAAAEDIVADSLLAALDHGRSLRDDAALRPWLLRIATNKALRYRQRAAHVVELQVVEGAVAEPRGPSADDSLVLWQAVRDLPPRMRAAVGLRYYLDLPVETVAEVLDVSPTTIKPRRSRPSRTCGQRSPTRQSPSRRCDMRDLDDAALELRLREVLKEHLGALPLDLTVDSLARRREASRVARRIG